jgi:hypothetical protein
MLVKFCGQWSSKQASGRLIGCTLEDQFQQRIFSVEVRYAAE